MKKIEDSKNIVQGKWILYVVFIIFAFLQIVLTIRLFDSIKPLKNNSSNIIVKYTNGSEFNTKVKLKDSTPIEFENPDMLDSYILQYIDGFDITSKFNYDADKVADVKLDYKVNADIVAYYKESLDSSANPKVWEKKEVITDSEVSFTNSDYALILPLSINLDKYVTQINEFHDLVNLPIDGYIQITLDVNITGKIGEDKFTDTYVDTMKIPITSSVVKVSTYSKEPTEKIVYYDDTREPTLKAAGINVFLTLANFFCLLLTMKGLFLQKKMTEYRREINNLLRNYDDIIITTSTCISLSKYNVVEINEFKELLNLSRESAIPIFFYEDKQKNISIFYILSDGNAFVYTIYEYDENEVSNTKRNKLTK